MADPTTSVGPLPAGWSRRARILDIVNARGHSTVAELAEAMGVSHMTIRRDISRLDAAGEVVSFHGGVRPVGAPTTALAAFSLREGTRTAEKTAIAQRALAYVESGSVVSIDSGSTAAMFARQIPEHLELSVVTSSLAVVEALVSRPRVDVLSLGGQLRRQALSFVGARTVANIPDLQVDTHFLAAAALSERGAFDLSDDDASVKRALRSIARRTVLLADSSKFDQIAVSRICTWNDVDIVVTDGGVSSVWRRRLEEQDVEVVIAD